MKHDWEYKKLGEVLEIPSRNGLSKPTSIRGEGVPMISMGELFANPIIKNSVECPLVPVTDNELNSSKLEIGDLLFARQSLSLEGAGKCSFVESCNNPTVFESHLIRIRVKKDVVEPKFIFDYFLSPFGKLEIRKRVYQVAAAGIKGSELVQIPVPLPPLSTQQSIVSELDSLSQIIADCKETLKDYDALEQSIFYNMFGDPVKNDKGWEVKELKSLCREIGDGLHGTPEYLDNSNLYFVNGNNLNDGFIEIKENTKSVTENAYEQYYIELDEKTLLISINGTLGKVAFYRNEKIILGKSACYLKVGNDIDIIYLYRLLSSHYFRNYMESECTGTTIRNVSLKTMRNYNCPLPPLALQQQFASKIEAIEQMKEEMKKALQEAETLFQARMDYWFN